MLLTSMSQWTCEPNVLKILLYIVTIFQVVSIAMLLVWITRDKHQLSMASSVLVLLASSQRWVLTHMYSVTGALLTVWAVAGRLASLP